jgi:hypothetical protein
MSSRKARTSAIIAVLIVGSRSGANRAECRDGSGVPDFIAASYFAGSTAPTRSISVGMPAS